MASVATSKLVCSLRSIAPRPAGGKSQAIEHNSALPKVGPVATQASLGVAYRWRALRVRVMVCYVLRPQQSQHRYSALRVVSFSAMRNVELSLAHPAGLPAAARTSLLVPASATLLPIRPGGGLPKSMTITD